MSVPCAFFTFLDESTFESKREFVFLLTNAALIQHARDLLNGSTQDDPLVIGNVVKSPALYNPNWSFYLDPRTILFTSFSVEVADATVMYVQENLPEVGKSILPYNTWCPWSARLTREIPIREIGVERLRSAFAFFSFVDESTTEKKHEFTVLITDSDTISQARSILEGKTKDSPLISGKVVKSPAAYNLNWSFHLNPATVKFLSAAAISANRSTVEVEKNLTEVGKSMLPNNVWTPFTAKLTREVQFLHSL